MYLVRKLSSINLSNYMPLRELVFKVLKEAIITEELKPGERLMEVKLAEDMGVSRTPVREAIRKLELEGLVVMVPRKGAYVADISVKDAAEVFEIRWALEGLAASLASQRITDMEIKELEKVLEDIQEAAKTSNTEMIIKKDSEFHNILFNSTKNERLAQIINNLKQQIYRFRVESFRNPERFKKTIQEHKAIIDAIKERDADKAEKITKNHIKKAEDNVMIQLKDHKKCEGEQI